ncbi:MAG TPA: RNA polymerase sigma-70 factor [Prolixibacteraceae bacterium]|nr:RNA polymerase sigma-70 factor [Prolixibacteraceae bacterium]
MAEKHDDHSLVQLLQEGNVIAFDSLFKVYSSKLFYFALKYIKNESDTEELVQEVFVQVWEHHHTLKSELSFKSYLFTVTLNKIRKHFNKKAISLRYLESLEHDPELTDNEKIQGENYESLLQQVYFIIDQMPPRRREIFMKSKLEGKSSKEIAIELDISYGTVDNQVSEALKFIRSKINNENLAFMLFAVLFLY